MTPDRELNGIEEINRQIALRVSLRDSYVGDGYETKADVIQGEIVGLIVARDIIASRPSSEVERVRGYLNALKRGDCWCEVAIDNPNFHGVHSNICVTLQDYFNALLPQRKEEKKAGG